VALSPGFASELSAYLPPSSLQLVIDLNVRRNQPQCSNVALNIRTRQSHCGSCRSKGGRCRGTNGNSSYIFSAEKCTFIIKYSKTWKWCRTFRSITTSPSSSAVTLSSSDGCGRRSCWPQPACGCFPRGAAGHPGASGCRRQRARQPTAKRSPFPIGGAVS
jgi:hypothetical protein